MIAALIKAYHSMDNQFIIQRKKHSNEHLIHIWSYLKKDTDLSSKLPIENSLLNKNISSHSTIYDVKYIKERERDGELKRECKEEEL